MAAEQTAKCSSSSAGAEPGLGSCFPPVEVRRKCRKWQEQGSITHTAGQAEQLRLFLLPTNASKKQPCVTTLNSTGNPQNEGKLLGVLQVKCFVGARNLHYTKTKLYYRGLPATPEPVRGWWEGGLPHSCPRVQEEAAMKVEKPGSQNSKHCHSKSKRTVFFTEAIGAPKSPSPQLCMVDISHLISTHEDTKTRRASQWSHSLQAEKGYPA